jgi:hypothetical protein
MFLLKFLLPFIVLAMIVAGGMFVSQDDEEWLPAIACWLIAIAYAFIAYFWITRF